MDKITATKSEEGYNIALTATDADANAKDCSSYTTYKLQMWKPGLDPDTSANLIIDDAISWTSDGSDGAATYTIADGDLDTAGVYHGRVYLAKTGVIEILSVFAIILPSPINYCTIDEIKSELEITGNDYDDFLEAMCEQATDLIDEYCNRTFNSTTATRYFDGADNKLLIDDIVSVTTLKLDVDCDGSFEISLTEDTDYNLMPLNTTPKMWIEISSRTDRTYHNFNPGVRKGVQIIGVWGYAATVPRLIRRAAIMQVGQWFKLRESGFTGVSGSPEFGGVTMVKKGLDPNIRLILSKFKRVDFY